MPEKNILIADDDQVILDILKEMIQREGYKVFLTSNGKEAVEAVKINPIDLAILDIKMPVMDGIEALEKIKKIDQGIEVLIMTGYADLETLKQAISDYGAFDYILKPFKRADILNGIQNALLKRDFASQKKLRDKEPEERIIQLEKEFHERTHQLRESQIKYRDIVENSNDAIVVVQDGKLKFANTKTVELTGYPQEELKDMSFLEMVHPEDRDMVAESYKSEDFPNIFYFRALRKNGESLWVEINAVRTTWEKRQANLNVIRDITERKRLEETLRSRETILRAVGSASVRFLRATSLEEGKIQEILAQLGQATKISRVYIFENHIREDGTHLTSQRYEWVGPGITPQIDNPDLHNFPWQADGMGRWENMLMQGQIIQGHVREFPASEKRLLAPQDIQSIVAVPIFVSEKWWGFIGFDECQKEREWYAAEIDALKISGAILGALIERKQAEEALGESEKQYKLATSAGKVGVWDWNIETNEIYLDPNLKAMLGYADHEIRNHLDDWGKHVHTDDVELVMAEANAHLEGLKPHYEVVHRMLHKDGSIKWFLARGTTTRDADGKPYRMVGTDTDITEVKKAEEALQESEQKFRNLADSSPSMIFVYQAGKVVYANKVCKDLMGYTIEEFLLPDFDFLCLIAPESVELIKDKQSEHMQGKEVTPYEYVLLTKDGERLNAIMTSRLIDYQGESAILGIITDITERKRVEEALRESEAQKTAILDGSIDRIRLVDKDMKIIWANKTTARELNIAPGDLIGQFCYKAFVGRDRPCDKCPNKKALKTGKIEHAILKQPFLKGIEGETYWDGYSVPIKNESGDIVNLIQITRDITERKWAEKALKESENRFRELFDRMSSGVAVYEPIDYGSDFIIKDYNKAGERISKINREHIVGRSVLEVFPGIKKFGLFEVFQRVWKIGEPEHHPVSLYQDDCLTHWAENYVYKLLSGEIVAVFDDVTERVQAEEELKRSREELRNLTAYLQSAREQERTNMAREIHDELAQALTALKMDISWLSKKLPKDQKTLLEKTRSMTKLTDTTIKTVKKISTELRPGLLDDLGLIAAIEWQTEEFQNRTGVTCRLDVDPEDIIVEEKRSTTLFRIFQETLTNIARHAKATRVTASLKEKAGRLELKVKDNGKGITEKQISDHKSFGLIGIRERAKDWGGEMKIKGVPGKGTTVVVRIPVEEISRKGAKDAK